MNIEELKSVLIEKGVPHDMYSISIGGFPNEAFCLVENGGKWEVYYSERGKKRGDKFFSLESDACEYLLKKLEKYSTK